MLRALLGGLGFRFSVWRLRVKGLGFWEDFDPLNKVPLKRAISGVAKGPL